MSKVKKFVFHLCRFVIQVVLYVLEGMVSLCDALAFKVITIFKKPEYVRMGKCQMTGQCCRAIGMAFPRSWQQWPWILNVIKKWHYLRYNFHFIGMDDNMLIYECHYLTADNKCGIQRFKPALCRQFPKLPIFGFTKLHKGCGYFFQKRNPSKFEKILYKQIEDERNIVEGERNKVEGERNLVEGEKLKVEGSKNQSNGFEV